MKKLLAVLLLTPVLLWSCGDDDEPSGPAGEYASGVFVINEGNFGGGNASISHFDPVNSEVDNGIFTSVNGVALGDVAQSMTLSGDQAYIVVNNSTKVEIVNYGTFTSTGTISEGLANPRYMAVNGTTGFISNWGSFDDKFQQVEPPFIAVVDLSDNSLTTKVNAGSGPEHIFVFEGKLFVSNSFTNNVQAFDVENYNLLGTTELTQGPGQIVIDGDNNLWVVSAGSFGGNDGALTCINTSNYGVEREVRLGFNPASRLVVNEGDNTLYFYSGNSIYQFFTRDAEPALLTEMSGFVGIYGIGYSDSEDLIYVGDAVGFAGEGKVARLNTDGSVVDEFPVGVGPNSFVFTP